MKNQKRILGTTKRRALKSLLEFAKFWNTAPSIYEFSQFATGRIVTPQAIYWMAKYPGHNIPLRELNK